MRKHIAKSVFGWMPKRVKINGKRLVPNSFIVYKLMVSVTAMRCWLWLE